MLGKKNLSDNDIVKHWSELSVFGFDIEDIQSASPRPVYSIDTPPPTVSGTLHMGHVFSYCHCDFIARFQRMNGANVFYPIGFDDNGLPTERLTEKKHNIRAIKMVRDGDREKFLDICKEVINEEELAFESLFRSLGFSFDWNRKYQTISSTSQKIANISFADLFYKGMVYLSNAPVYWDVIDQTALAQADIEEKPLQSFAHNINFKIYRDNSSSAQTSSEAHNNLLRSLSQSSPSSVLNNNNYALEGVCEIMTTRPELLPACVCLLYNPNDNRYNGNAVGSQLSITRVDDSILDINGSDLNCCFAVTPFGLPIPIFPHEDVRMEKGTGLVMCCSFGDWQDVIWLNDLILSHRDYDITKKVNVIVGDNGRIANAWYKDLESSHVGDTYALRSLHLDSENSRTVHSAREHVIILLKEKFVQLPSKQVPCLTTSQPINHSVKCAERSGKPVEILHKPQWYIDFGFGVNNANINAHEQRGYFKHDRCCYINTVHNVHNIQVQKGRIAYISGISSTASIPNSTANTKNIDDSSFACNRFQSDVLSFANKVKFYPESMRKRLNQWICGLNQDWCISRNRFAGIPLPSLGIFVTEDRDSFAILPYTEDNLSDSYQKLAKAKTGSMKMININQILQSEAGSVGVSVQQYIAECINGKHDSRWLCDINDHLHDMGGIAAALALVNNSKDLVFDTWFTSSVSPQINTGFVCKDQDIIDAFNISEDATQLHKKLYPFSLRPQAHEIIRTWTFYTVVKAYLHSLEWNDDLQSWDDSSDEDIDKFLPWKHVMLSGWCLASDKTKMSKSKGNIVNPISLIEKNGADAIRYWAASGHLGIDTPYNEANIKNGTRLIKKLCNVFAFCCMHPQQGRYANKEACDLLDNGVINEVIDKWILARLKHTYHCYVSYFAKLDYCRALETIEAYFWSDLCENYIELIKGRIYGKDSFAYKAKHHGQLVDFDDDLVLSKQQSAISTLRYVLSCTLKLFAPFLPFTAEKIYLNNKDLFNNLHKSVHSVGSFNGIAEYEPDSNALAAGDEAIKIIGEVRKYKAAHNLSVKAPITEIITNTLPDGCEFDLRCVCNAISADIIVDKSIPNISISHQLID